jgi:hypothetical protein
MHAKTHGFLQIFLTFHLGLGSHEKKELEQSPTEARTSKKLSHMLFSRIIGEWDFFLMPIVTPCHTHTMNVGDVDLHDWLLSWYVDIWTKTNFFYMFGWNQHVVCMWITGIHIIKSHNHLYTVVWPEFLSWASTPFLSEHIQVDTLRVIVLSPKVDYGHTSLSGTNQPRCVVCLCLDHVLVSLKRRYTQYWTNHQHEVGKWRFIMGLLCAIHQQKHQILPEIWIPRAMQGVLGSI